MRFLCSWQRWTSPRSPNVFWTALRKPFPPSVAAQIALVVFARGTTLIILWIAASWLLGLFGNDIRRWALQLRGYTLAHVIAARDADGAFARLLTARPDLADLFLPARPKK